MNQDPSVSILYGYSGVGKSAQLIYAFPNAYFIAPKGGLKPQSFVGYGIPASRVSGDQVKTIDDILALIPKISKQGIDSLCIDDFSYIARLTSDVYESKYGTPKDYLRPWRMFAKTMVTFRDAVRDFGLHVGMDAHEAPPETKNGRFIKGSPKIPGQMREEFPVMCDLVARVVHEGMLTGADPDTQRPRWPFMMFVDPDDPTWYTKDRDSVVRGRAPLNLGEVLRVNYALKRLPGLEWQDEVADAIAKLIVQGAPRGDVFQQANALMRSKYLAGVSAERAMPIMRWTWNDGDARAQLRRAKYAEMAAYGLGASR